MVFPRFLLCLTHIERAAHRSKKQEKSTLEPFGWIFSRRTCQNLIWGAPGLDFVTVWVFPSASWAALGRSWGSLGRSWGPLGRVLGASWASLERSWVSPGCQMLPKRAPDSISEGSGSVRGRVGSSQSCIFRGFFIPAFSSNMVHEFLQKVHFKIHSSFSFTPCSAAVRAQRVELEPKSQCWPPKDYHAAPP